MRDASERLKYLNIILAALAIPVLGLAARDYLVLRYRPPLKVQQTAHGQSDAAAPSFESYSPILEKGLFPTTARQLTRIDLLKAGPGEASSLLSMIKLLGTYSGKRGFAVFEKSGSAEQDVFKPGDKVFDAGILTAVGPETATVSTGASEVTFTIYKEDIPGGLSEMGQTDQPPQEGASQGGYTEKVSENEWNIDQKAVLSSLDDMGKIMTDARLTPKKAANGTIEGFLVNEVKAKGIFDAIGIKNGDVLTSINGYKIDSPEKAVQVLSALRGEESISLDIIREGRPRSFRYSIR